MSQLFNEFSGSYTFSCALIKLRVHCGVWKAFKKQELPAAPRATLAASFSCALQNPKCMAMLGLTHVKRRSSGFCHGKSSSQSRSITGLCLRGRNLEITSRSSSELTREDGENRALGPVSRKSRKVFAPEKL